MQREGRTRPYEWHHEWHEERLTDQRYFAQLAQEKAEKKKAALARAQSANAASSSQANHEVDDKDRLTTAQETEIRAAFADYKQRYLAKHGQAVWDKGDWYGNPLDLLVPHLEELIARPAPTA